MFDRLVADGDRTTTGGFVIARSSMYNEEGKQYARKENHATCGNCKGKWPIYGTATDWTDDGVPMVKDRDKVLCPCGKNFVLAAANSSVGYSVDCSDEPDARPATNTANHWIAFRLNEHSNCTGLRCVAHFTDGSKEYGTFDAGNTARFERADNGNTCVRVDLLLDERGGVSASVTELLLSAAISG